MEEKAQALEDKRLFRRAAKIWGELLLNSYEADKQEYYRRRMDRCLEAVKRPPPVTDSYGDVSRAAKEAQNRMGIAQENGNAFRLNGGKRKSGRSEC